MALANQEPSLKLEVGQSCPNHMAKNKGELGFSRGHQNIIARKRGGMMDRQLTTSSVKGLKRVFNVRFYHIIGRFIIYI